MPTSRPQLVIFDCDGVLVDSEPLSVAILLELIATAGVVLSEEQAYRLFLGRSLASVREILRTRFGFTMNKAQLERLRLEIDRRFRDSLQPVPGVLDALSRLGTRCCVASSGNPDRIRLSLGVTGLLEMLEPHIYSASMVERGKPAPDLFLLAARDMGVRPADCIVIEDSPAGIDAARNAGMRVFAFTGGSHAANAALVAELAKRKPDITFSDMTLLPELVAGVRKRAAS